RVLPGPQRRHRGPQQAAAAILRPQRGPDVLEAARPDKPLRLVAQTVKLAGDTTPLRPVLTLQQPPLPRVPHPALLAVHLAGARHQRPDPVQQRPHPLTDSLRAGDALSNPLRVLAQRLARRSLLLAELL